MRVGREATAAPYFISEEMGTFSFDWGTLLLSEVQVLWANPPFAILGKLVAKLEEDACRVVLIMPDNEEKPCRQPLKKLAKKSCGFSTSAAYIPGRIPQGSPSSEEPTIGGMAH